VPVGRGVSSSPSYPLHPAVRIRTAVANPTGKIFLVPRCDISSAPPPGLSFASTARGVVRRYPAVSTPVPQSSRCSQYLPTHFAPQSGDIPVCDDCGEERGDAHPGLIPASTPCAPDAPGPAQQGRGHTNPVTAARDENLACRCSVITSKARVWERKILALAFTRRRGVSSSWRGRRSRSRWSLRARHLSP